MVCVSINSGMIFPLQVGQEAPQPLPDPVALTIAPARIDMIEDTKPAKVNIFNRLIVISDYL